MRARWPRTGIVWLGVVSLGELLSGAPFFVEALRHPESPADFLPLALYTLATLLGSVATVPAFREARRPAAAGRTPVVLAWSSVVVLVAATVLSLAAAAGVESVPPEPGDLIVTATDFTFGDAAVEASAGDVAVAVTNTGSSRHTFTIDELGVDLDVPPGTTQRVTFTAAAGVYRFYCRPHGPAMEGQLSAR